MPPHRHAYRPVVMGRRGAVVSAHPLATMAGIEILLAGGNAVDAAVAVASTLNVAEPFMSGVGGIGLMVITHARSRERHVLDFIGRAPKASDATRVTEAEIDGGPKACVTPGNVGGWLAALERFGTMSRAHALAPAIRLAEDGAPLTWKSCEFIDKARATLARSADAERIYLGQGPLRPGRVLVQKELAGTLRQIAEGGAEVFYRGPVAKVIARSVREAGGWLSEEDLAAFTPEWRVPTDVPFKGYRLATVPQPFSAFQYLQTLNILEGYDLAGWGHNSVDYLHHLIEAIKLASADRLAYAYLDTTTAGLTTKAYAAAQRARIDARRAGVSEGERYDAATLPGQILAGHPAKYADEHTTHFAAADREGNVVTVTQTLGGPFGSGFVANGTGIVLNNLLKWTDLAPESPNRLKPGRKAGTMMSPTQIFRDGEFVMSIGTPGSYGILQTTPQMILNVLEFGLNIQEAIEAPRVRVYRDRLLDAESRIGAPVREALAARGHQVNVIDDWSWIVGGGQGIVRDPESGALMGGADPRRDGYAVAV
ncbi:MAG: gamma-glutamyltransferase [Candidatus Rokubacteria bacterium]|nr:gamma-glutamyltransferase [Candidatus Rokubacteria bacterium]